MQVANWEDWYDLGTIALNGAVDQTWGRYAFGARCFVTALRLRPGLPAAHYHLGFALQMLRENAGGDWRLMSLAVALRVDMLTRVTPTLSRIDEDHNIGGKPAIVFGYLLEAALRRPSRALPGTLQPLARSGVCAPHPYTHTAPHRHTNPRFHIQNGDAEGAFRAYDRGLRELCSSPSEECRVSPQLVFRWWDALQQVCACACVCMCVCGGGGVGGSGVGCVC